MATIVRCNCGAEYERTEAKFLMPHTGHVSCEVCGAVLESWVESTHVATFELVKRQDRKPAGIIWRTPTNEGWQAEDCGTRMTDKHPKRPNITRHARQSGQDTSRNDRDAGYYREDVMAALAL